MESSAQSVEAQVENRHWWFRVRRRILDQLLAEALGAGPLPRRALDVGCGTGGNAPVLARWCRELVGVDRAVTPLVEGRRGSLYATQLRGDVAALPFADGRFELVVTLDLLEHLEDDAAGLRELTRVLAPGGLLVVFVPAQRWLWGFQDQVSHHHRRYDRAALRALLAGAGLELQRLTAFNLLLLPPILLGRGLLKLWTPRGLRSENELTGPQLDRLLGRIFALELPLLRRRDLPLGVSLAALARRRRGPA